MDHDQRFKTLIQAYLPLDADGQREFEHLLATEPYRGIQAMNTTWYEKGIEKGRRVALQELLDAHFGPLSPELLARLEQIPAGQLEAFFKVAVKAKSLAELGLGE